MYINDISKIKTTIRTGIFGTLAWFIGWLPSLPPADYDYEIQRRGTDSAWISLTVTSSLSYLDTNILAGERLYYRIRGFQGALSSNWSEYATGLALEWAGNTDLIRRYDLDADSVVADTIRWTKLFIYLPEAGEHWIITWTFTDSTEIVKARCDFDYDNDGNITLSDFAVFGVWYAETEDPNRLSEFTSFGNVFNAPGRYFYEGDILK